jgi:conflict system STAND superfamily ATPase
MPRYRTPEVRTTEVFTPTSPAKLTFVERHSINDQLVAALKTPGKQIVVYGHSGSGKTTLLTRKLEQTYERHVISRCSSTTTFESLLITAFERLEYFYATEQSITKRGLFSAGIETQFLRIKSLLGTQQEKSEATKTTRLVPPQLTPQTLAELLGHARACWILEDFHKVEESEKVKLAQCLKVFMDTAEAHPEVKIIAIGAVDTAREVVQFDPEMRNRVSEIPVPLMSSDELSEIVKTGARLLNIKFEPRVIDSITWFSNGLASVCHALCLYACEAAGVVETLNSTMTLDESHFQKALERYVSEASDSLKHAFEKAFRSDKKTKFDNYRIVIRALASFGQDGASKADLLAKIRKSTPNYPPSNLKHCLNQLTAEDRGSLVRYSKSSGAYSFADPVFRAFALTSFREQLAPSGFIFSLSHIFELKKTDFVIKWMESRELGPWTANLFSKSNYRSAEPETPAEGEHSGSGDPST